MYMITFFCWPSFFYFPPLNQDITASVPLIEWLRPVGVNSKVCCLEQIIKSYIVDLQTKIVTHPHYSILDVPLNVSPTGYKVVVLVAAADFYFVEFGRIAKGIHFSSQMIRNIPCSLFLDMHFCQLCELWLSCYMYLGQQHYSSACTMFIQIQDRMTTVLVDT